MKHPLKEDGHLGSSKLIKMADQRGSLCTFSRIHLYLGLSFQQLWFEAVLLVSKMDPQDDRVKLVLLVVMIRY